MVDVSVEGDEIEENPVVADGSEENCVEEDSSKDDRVEVEVERSPIESLVVILVSDELNEVEPLDIEITEIETVTVELIDGCCEDSVSVLPPESSEEGITELNVEETGLKVELMNEDDVVETIEPDVESRIVGLDRLAESDEEPSLVRVSLVVLIVGTVLYKDW